jgi:hypothetical protein
MAEHPKTAAARGASEHASRRLIEYLATLAGQTPAEVGSRIVSFIQDTGPFTRVLYAGPEGDVLACSKGEIGVRAELRPRVRQVAEAFKASSAPERTLWAEKHGASVMLAGADPSGKIDPALAGDPSPEVHRAVQNYVNSISPVLGVLPLRFENAPLGYLLVELGQTPRPEDGVGERLHAIAQSSIRALNVAHTKFQAPAPVRKAKAMGRLATILALVALVFLIPVPFEMPAEGDLQAEQKTELSHGFTTGSSLAEVVEVKCTYLQRVEKGQVLFRLRSGELSRQIADVRSQLEAKEGEKYQLTLGVLTDKGDLTDIVRTHNKAKAVALANEVSQKRSELDSLLKMEESLIIRAPLDGILIEPREPEKLIGRSLRSTDKVATVADPAATWSVQLWMDEPEYRHVRAAKDKRGENLAVRFSLGSDPNTSYSGRIRHVDPILQLKPDDKSGIKKLHIKVDIDPGSSPPPEVGATVRGKVDAGTTSLGYWAFWRILDKGRQQLPWLN